MKLIDSKKALSLFSICIILISIFPFNNLKALAVTGETELIIHYQEAYQNAKDWNLWVWGDNEDGGVHEFTGKDDFGKYAKVRIDGDFNKVGFIVRTNEWEKDGGDRWIENIKDGRAEVWVLSGDDTIYYSKPSLQPYIKKATIDNLNEINITTNVPFDINKQKIEIDGVEINEVVSTVNKSEDNITNQIKVVTKKELDLNKIYTIKMENYGETIAVLGKVVRSERFDDLFYYDGNDLGNVYTPSKTKFRLWAPTANEAKLVIYRKWNAQTGIETIMKKDKKGTWITELKGNQKGIFYTYKVKIGDKWNEAVDPYVRATSVNGDKGAVVDLEETDPKGWKKDKKPGLKNPEDSIIYELSVRDLSIQSESGIKNKGKYLGAAESGTRGPNGVKTGLDYIKDLGVTHVQFLPIADFEYVNETKLNEPQYNWGYSPENFNVPEGSYSTNPYEPTVRIIELKKMIQTLHDNDLRVVMDVVYNHMYDAAQSNFNKLVPGYYYRYNENGSLANGTGVGNDTASERKMMRKFMVDSVKYWVKEYHMDGFRFDLMGIHDVDTMNAIRKEVDKMDPSIILHGEGWDLNTPLAAEVKANQKNAKKMEGIAYFNDNIRDGLKGSSFSDTDTGFINGKKNMEEQIKKGIMAGIDYDNQTATYQDPEQVLTYAEAHDDLTLWDKLELTNPHDSEDIRKKMHQLASSIVLTSQGIPFLHAGQEFMRTKDGVHNSYVSPDSINQLDWVRRAEYDKEVNYMKGLIDLRNNHPAFRMTTAEQIRRNLIYMSAPQNVIAFKINGQATGDKAKQLVIVHNANKSSVEIKLPSNGPWKVLVNGERAGNKVLDVVKKNTITVPALSSFVLETGKSVKQGFSLKLELS